MGATTGRDRRCGWLDVVLLREAARLNGFTELVLTKLDVLSGLPELRICTAYKVNGVITEYSPQADNGLAGVEPVYESMPGWTECIEQCAKWEDLPEAARKYIARLEELAGVPATIISVGPDRDQTIQR